MTIQDKAAAAPAPPRAKQSPTEVLNTVIGAANDHVCINLGYGGTERLIEPYGFKFSGEGKMLLQAYKRGAQDELRTYRFDRIETADRTKLAFRSAKALSWAPVAAAAGPAVAAALVKSN